MTRSLDYSEVKMGAIYLSSGIDFLDRRAFVQVAGAACISNAIRPAFAQSAANTSGSCSSPFRLGVVVWVAEGESTDAAIRGVREFGLTTCQIGFEHLTVDVAAPLKSALAKYGVEATAFSEHGPGARIFDFYRGPETIGIVPAGTREARINNLKLAADLAAECGIPAIHTHCGFIPENPNDPLYAGSVAAVRKIGSHAKERGVSFLCETGEETPITLLRMIQDAGMDNVFVNLDLANLILYGKGNPVDAMDVLGHLVRGIHAKDGLFPTDPKGLGKEVRIGEGKVDFPAVFERLLRVKYQGPITIERETRGAEQRADILRSKNYLENLIRKTCSGVTRTS
jgi:L-ribulose-5-phosphate 3-epimerase